MATSTPTSTSRVGERSPSASASAFQSPCSPTRLSRMQEKEQLRHLNDRLAAYIERARALEADKQLLRVELDQRHEETSREHGALRLLYETELADARKMLDSTANDRARLQVELGQTREELRQLQTRNSKKETDLNHALNRLRELEAHLNSKEAELATATGSRRSLEGQLLELKDQVASLECTLRDTAKHLHDEMLRRVDLENKAQTLREQLEFEKSIHDQEISETKKRHETKIVEIDSGRRMEFESKLAEALHELRRDHAEQIQEYKEELERTFSAKMDNVMVMQMSSDLATSHSQEHIEEFVDRLLASEVQEQIDRKEVRELLERKENQNPLLQLENAQISAAKNNDYASAAREEMTAVQSRMDSLTAQVTEYQRRNSCLENQVKELKDTLESERDMHRKRLNDKDREVADMRQKLQAHLEEYEQLLDVKLALDMEIHAYRKMLEGEEQRMNLSSSPSGRSPVSRASTSQGGFVLRGKKRKLNEGDRGDVRSHLKIVQHASSSGNVSVDEVDTDGKFIRLRNNSLEDQPLNGWTIRRQLGTMAEITYKFPSRFLLKAGQTVTVWCSGVGVGHRPPTDLVWKSQKTWGVGDNVAVTLIDSKGEEVAERTITRVCEEGAGELDEFEEEELCAADFRHPSHRVKDPSCGLM